MNKNFKVLVIGDDTRSFLSTVRSLGRQGIEVHVAPFDFRSPALVSRYIEASHFLPYYLGDGREWVDATSSLLRKHDFDLVIPCDERGLLPLYLNRAELGVLCSLAIPSTASIDVFFDKVRTRELAQTIGVPIARGRVLLAEDTVDAIVADTGLPVVLKEPKSYSLPELYVRTSTKILKDRSELEAWLTRHDRSRSILLEEMFPGFGLGVSVLCHEGKILQAFEHHRAHEVNGSSYYRRSAPLNDERLGAVERMVAAVAYTGLAMFEFKSDPASGNWILIEVNARPWGSLPLPVSIGVDFPYRLFRLLVLKEITAQLDYPVGRYCRNLIGDMWQFRAAAARFLRQPHKFLEHCFKWLWSFHRIVLGREHHDTLVLDDLAPGLRELRDMFGSSGRSLLGKGISLKGPDLRLPQRLAQLAQGDAETLKVLFVCQGNINRSSYAELKSTQLLGSERLRFYSAGMLPRNRRSSPAMAVASASRHGVDMSAHQSRHVEAAMLEEADLVIAFDNEILRSVASRYPNMLGRIHLLGEADPEGELEIPDPEGQDEATYSAVYQRIDVCLTRLTEAVPIPSTDGISLC